MTPSNTLRLMQLNDVRLVGRLTRDPEVRYARRAAKPFASSISPSTTAAIKMPAENGAKTRLSFRSLSGAKRPNAAVNA